MNEEIKTQKKIPTLDLFSGIGGITKALEEWCYPIAYCEKEPYAQMVLLSRMENGDLPNAPICDDVCTLKARHLPIKPEIIVGGWPCQDISVAGHGKGLDGKRSGLFYEVLRLVKEIEPTFVFLENVPAIRTRGLREVIRAFTDIRYDCRWTCVYAAEVKAPHFRQRWFLLAHKNVGHSEHNGSSPSEKSRGHEETLNSGSKSRSKRKWKLKRTGSVSKNMAYSESIGSQRLWAGRIKKLEASFGSEIFGCSGKGQEYSNWKIEPDVDRVVNGIPFRMERIKCLGNGVVSAQVKKAFIKLLVGESFNET